MEKAAQIGDIPILEFDDNRNCGYYTFKIELDRKGESVVKQII